MPWGIIAASVIGGLFNSGSGGGSAPSASTMPSMTPEQNIALQQLLARLTGRTSSTTPYGGQLSTGVTPGQSTSLAALQEQAMQAVRANTNASDVVSGAMTDQGTDFGDYFRTNVENPAFKTFNERTMPALGGRFKGNAIFGSDARTAERQAGQDLTSTLEGTRAKMAFDTSEAAKNRRLVAAGMVPQFGASSANILGSLFAAQGANQATQQSALDRQYQEFVRGQQGSDQNISQILAALGLQPLNTVVTPGMPGFATAAAPGIGSALTNAALRRWLGPNAAPGSGPGYDPSLYTSDPGSFGGA